MKASRIFSMAAAQSGEQVVDGYDRTIEFIRFDGKSKNARQDFPIEAYATYSDGDTDLRTYTIDGDASDSEERIFCVGMMDALAEEFAEVIAAQVEAECDWRDTYLNVEEADIRICVYLAPIFADGHFTGRFTHTLDKAAEIKINGHYTLMPSVLIEKINEQLNK